MADTISDTSRAGVRIRFVIYMALAAITAFTPALEALTPDKMAAMHWPQWIAYMLTPLGAVLVTYRSFIDQSLTKHVEAADETPPKAIPVPEDQSKP